MTADDHVTPHDLDAERAVLGVCLRLGRLPESDGVTGLRPCDFFRDAHRVVFRAMQDLSVDGVEIDLLTLKNQLSPRELEDVGGQRISQAWRMEFRARRTQAHTPASCASMPTHGPCWRRSSVPATACIETRLRPATGWRAPCQRPSRRSVTVAFSGATVCDSWTTLR